MTDRYPWGWIWSCWRAGVMALDLRRWIEDRRSRRYVPLFRGVYFGRIAVGVFTMPVRSESERTR